MTPLPALLGPRTTRQLTGCSPVLLVPVGSCEQHGPHLPLDTDTRIAVAVAQRAAERIGADRTLVAPAIAIGASGEHQGFAGTLSIGEAALEHLVVELTRSADRFGGVVVVNAHGGNARALRRASAVATGEGRRLLVWHAVVDGGDPHAGRTETSLLLALHPEFVHLQLAERGVTAALAEIAGELVRGGVAAVSPNGVLGDPSGASAAEGERLLARLVSSLVAALVAEPGFGIAPPPP